MSRLAILVAALTVSTLTACAPGVEEPTTSRAAMRFNAELAGLVPGRPQNCLPLRSSASVVAARGKTLLFREGRMVYASETSGGCAAAADSQYALVTENFSGSLCSGTLARVVDLNSSGSLRGTCMIGDFTPYRRP